MKNVVLVAVGCFALATSVYAADAAKGKETFKTAKCAMCHSIGGVGGKMKALDGVGARLKADDIKNWVVAPTKMKADTKKKPVTVAPADLDDIVAYLLTVK